MNDQQVQTLLEPFDGITLQELDEIKLMNRVDTKFVFSIDSLNSLLPLLIKDFNCLHVNNCTIQTYKSLYFDDENFSLFKAHHNGRVNRFKVRIRNYVESQLYFLEIKHKVKNRTDKLRIELTDFAQKLDAFQIEFIHNVLQKKMDLLPVLWNEFQRITLSGKNRNERLTLDLHLNFNQDESNFVMENVVVAELKQDDLDRNSPFYQIMKKQGVRPLRVSKYCVGLYSIHGQQKIKGNRFKKKIKILNSINS
jgi:hypothetical protein